MDLVITTQQPKKVQFYVHFNERTLKISTVTANATPANGDKVVPVDYELGLKFIQGSENPANWTVSLIGGKYVVERVTSVAQFIGNRIDIVSTVDELEIKSSHENADVEVAVNYDKREVEVWYVAEKIKSLVRPVKLYFTRENDPAYLKCTVSLDVNVLNKLVDDDGKWVNPIKIKMKDLEDLSIYCVRTELSVSAYAK